MASFVIHPKPGLRRVDRLLDLAALLDADPKWHRWDLARADQRARKELFRFYHRPPDSPRLPASGIAVDRGRDGIGWLRFLGDDPDHARRALLALAQECGALANETDAATVEGSEQLTFLGGGR